MRARVLLRRPLFLLPKSSCHPLATTRPSFDPPPPFFRMVYGVGGRALFLVPCGLAPIRARLIWGPGLTPRFRGRRLGPTTVRARSPPPLDLARLLFVFVSFSIVVPLDDRSSPLMSFLLCFYSRVFLARRRCRIEVHARPNSFEPLIFPIGSGRKTGDRLFGNLGCPPIIERWKLSCGVEAAFFPCSPPPPQAVL